eukprot:TRINITY_DN433_c1_g1_i3.p1 TRINITY_DN433_c1_g1~~TRINITY_DN433_c1_g1_i3.p1  ORF type:complete len:329 (-),score=27.87 TRINITY_DN433_c1_g1_i3:396-1382(-)
MLKLRVRNNVNNTLFKMQIESNATLQALKTELKNQELKGDFYLSLNKKDLLENNKDETSLHDLGICSGDLIWIMFPENQQICLQNTQQLAQNVEKQPQIKTYGNNKQFQAEDYCQILNVLRVYNSVQQKLVSNNYDKFQAPFNLINIFHNLMQDLFFTTEEINDNFIAQSYFEQRYFLKHSESKKCCVDIKLVIFGNQWLIILGMVEGGWTFNYPIKFDNGVFGKLKINFEMQDDEVRRILINEVIYPLTLKCCLKMEVAFPFSLAALPTNVKDRVIKLIDQDTTAAKLSCTNKEFRSLVKSSESYCNGILRRKKKVSQNVSSTKNFN